MQVQDAITMVSMNKVTASPQMMAATPGEFKL